MLLKQASLRRLVGANAHRYWVVDNRKSQFRCVQCEMVGIIVQPRVVADEETVEISEAIEV